MTTIVTVDTPSQIVSEPDHFVLNRLSNDRCGNDRYMLKILRMLNTRTGSDLLSQETTIGAGNLHT
jgi:hypothetical protein